MTKEHARHVPIMGLCGPEAMVCMNCLSECNKTNGKGRKDEAGSLVVQIEEQ